MKLSIDMPTHAQVDRRFLWVVLAFGMAAIWGGSYWLQQGEIAIRSTDAAQRSAPVARHASAPDAAARIAGDHPLFYPLCIAWLGLGGTMLALATAALIRGKIWLDVLSAWSLAAVLPLGFLTLAVVYLFKSS